MPAISRRQLIAASAAATLAAGLPRHLAAAGRDGTLRYVVGTVWNGLDPAGFGNTREAIGLSTNVYDRLLRFGTRPEGDGMIFDFDRIEPELCAACEVGADGREITFTLREDATWHDGRPVTVEDVKWSLDRAVSAETMSKAQLATGGLTDPAQFTILDDRRLRVTLPEADRLALANLAIVYAPMINSALVREQAGPDDPWGVAWLRDNTAAGGAFRIARRAPDGSQVVLSRFDDWKSGPLPGLAEVVVQTVPEPATRAALVARGDADLSLDLLPTDIATLEDRPGVRVVATPWPSGFTALVFNTGKPPFDDPRLRRAIALALPYDRLLSVAAAGRAAPLYGADWPEGTPPSPDFPQPMPFATDPDAARALLAEAGLDRGFDTELFYGVSKAPYADPAAALIQEALAPLGIRVAIRKLPDAQMAEALTERSAPMMIETSRALFPSTEYFFRIFLSGPQRWNFPDWQDEEVAGILPRARRETDQAAYDAMARRLVARVAEEVPMALLWQPVSEAAMAADLSGYTVDPMQKADFRPLTRD